MNITRIHEAGHVLAAMQHGLEIMKVDINHDGSGFTGYRGQPNNPDWRYVVSLAGPAAEAVYLGEVDAGWCLEHFGGESDVRVLDGLPEDVDLFWRNAVVMWARQNMDEIERMADTLPPKSCI